jgi:hypothetical protein
MSKPRKETRSSIQLPPAEFDALLQVLEDHSLNGPLEGVRLLLRLYQAVDQAMWPGPRDG